MQNLTSISQPRHAAVEAKQPHAFPSEPISWLKTGRAGLSKKLLKTDLLAKTLARIETHGGWHWPDAPICFISDLHADADALHNTLISMGCLTSTAEGLQPTPKLLATRLVVGGDCLDKGPSNFALLNAINQLRANGVQAEIIAGNHDLRLLFGLQAMSNPVEKHFFVRMFPKVFPLFAEALLQPEAAHIDPSRIPNEAICQAALLPSKDWAKGFAQNYQGKLSQAVIAKEVKKTAKKMADIPAEMAKHGLSFQDLYKASLICRQLFLEPNGRLSWFFSDMKLMAQHGSFMFVHAGLCDEVVSLLLNEGIDAINDKFRHGLSTEKLTGLYFGPLFNTVRTKYRIEDFDLSPKASDLLLGHGIHAVVHGHRNRLQGQRLAMRQGVIHFEADITLDRNSRAIESLSERGAGALEICPSGVVSGYSNDYPFVKTFCPSNWAATA